MTILFEKIGLYLSYPFVRYALIVGVLIALCSSLLGVTLVLKRFSFIGDGLSHVAFGAMAIASVMNLTNRMALILPVTILCAVLLLRTGQNTKIKGDAAIAMISVGALAFGYLLMNIFSTSSNLTGDVCSTLFGSTSILTLTRREVWLSAILSLIVVAVFVFFYHKIFAITFDETFARSTGVKVGAYNMLLAVTIAVIIVLAMNLVGSLLISALVIFPALCAMRLFKSFKSVTIFAAALSVVCSFLGIMIAILAGTPVGSTIVAVDVAAFAICTLISHMRSRKTSLAALLLVMICAVLTGCSSGSSKSADIDVDLTKLSSTMVYSEVYNMMLSPEDYLGKTVRMDGALAVYHDPTNEQTYFSCVIADATACCAQGIEFVWAGEHSYPDDYPELDSEIEVTGRFEKYEEDGIVYYHITDAKMEKI